MADSPTFLPGARAANVIIAAGFLGVGTAMWIRYMVVEPSTVAFQCQAGVDAAQCIVRRTAVGIYRNFGFGLFALAFATLNLIRPSLVLFTIALVGTGFGLVLYNASLSGIAAGLLILSFARRVPRRDPL